MPSNCDLNKVRSEKIAHLIILREKAQYKYNNI